MLRIGLVSFAHMHMWSYARHLAEHPEVEIAAVLDLDPDRGRQACEKLGVEIYHAVPVEISRCRCGKFNAGVRSEVAGVLFVGSVIPVRVCAEAVEANAIS